VSPRADLSPEATLEVVVQRLADLKESLDALRADVTASRADVVPRGEWVQRNTTVDHRFEAQGREIGEIKQNMAAQRAPWWSVGALVCAAAALAWSVFGPTI